jgi:hypothetical protein
MITLLGGCSTASSPTVAKKGGKDDEQVRQAFAAFQAALKARDGAKLWDLLDKDSQTDAEKAAKVLQADYDKLPPQEKTAKEKMLGLTGDELAKLTAPHFLKSNHFYGAYDEVPDSKLDSVNFQGDEAVVSYTEADGDKKKLTLTRQDGQWRVSVPMPKVP